MSYADELTKCNENEIINDTKNPHHEPLRKETEWMCILYGFHLYLPGKDKMKME
jgi:hypothetical protein